jgi:Ribosomal protein L6e
MQVATDSGYIKIFNFDLSGLTVFSMIFQSYKASDVRKEDQAAVDKQILDLIRKSPEKKSIFGYLGSMFGLRSGHLPHKMKF